MLTAFDVEKARRDTRGCETVIHFNNAGAADKKRLKSILSRKKVTKKDLLSARRIINQTGALNAARKDIKRLVNKSGEILGSSSIKQPYKKSLRQLAENIVIA